VTQRSARVVAYSNIALAKYWGKAAVQQNLPAVPSLSMTLDGLRTVTRVTFDPDLEADEGTLDGEPLGWRPLARVRALIDRVRAIAQCPDRMRVESHNDFPTASGLASSASGFAALALAATRALGLQLGPGRVSGLARASSASAARSVFGGYAALGAREPEAERVAAPGHWCLTMLVAVTDLGPKAMGSTPGMQHTASTSPYYRAWLDEAPRVYEQARQAVLDKELQPLGEAMEHSTLMMHASMMAAQPAVMYLAPATLAIMTLVKRLRDDGLPAYYTMDAGPHVKVLTLPEHADQVVAALSERPEVQRIIRCEPGPDAHELTKGET
jgi:diphosphomevalonate decarboxylase